MAAKRLLTVRPLPFKTLVPRRLHVVVDAAPGDPADRGKLPCVRIEQHLVTLARLGHQPEGPRSAELQLRNCLTRDNLVMESFSLSLKTEWVWQRDYANHAQAMTDIAEYKRRLKHTRNTPNMDHVLCVAFRAKHQPIPVRKVFTFAAG